MTDSAHPRGARAGRPGAAPGVLLVEDNQADAELLCDLLLESCAGLCVVHRRDVPTAIRWLTGQGGSRGSLGRHRDPPARTLSLRAVLCDVRLPGDRGDALVRWLRASAHWRDVPAIMLSTADHPRDWRACREAGADGFLTKSSDPETLARKLGAALRPYCGARLRAPAGAGDPSRAAE